MRVELNRLWPGEFIISFHSVGWDPPEVDQVEIALDNSICAFSLYENNELIGMSRILGDKAMSFYIKDFVILPEKQNKGNEKILMNTIIATIKNKLSNGYKVSIELISSKGKEDLNIICKRVKMMY